ncbi:MAG: hypothetical protein A2V93_00890 [Ignavibacteria bacterium RBG_16_34_14]|nr:MAG: hypothetical protein A2V93_00890 [Ignavibacteria bacterium RBG_16_34_14]
MPKDLKDHLNELLKDTTDFAKDELINFISEAKGDSTDFVKRIGELTEKNVKRLALGKITRDEFKELMEDLLDLNKMQFHKISSDSKVRAQKIVNGITDLVLNKLLSLL